MTRETLLGWLMAGYSPRDGERQRRRLEREAETLYRRFCVEPGETYQAIAARWGRTRGCAAAAEAWGLRRLRHPARHRLPLADPDCPPRLLVAIFGRELPHYQARYVR